MLFFFKRFIKDSLFYPAFRIAQQGGMMVEDWLANAYKEMSRRQFLARMSTAGINLAGFALSSNSIAGEVIATSTQGLITADSMILSEGFQVPLYEARPSAV